MRRPKGQQQKNPARGFGAVGLQPFLVSRVFCLFTITLFPLKTGSFVHFSVSPFLSPWLLSFFLFHSLSLSLYLVSCFCFLVFLFIIFFPCFVCCSFLPCFFAFVSRSKYLKGCFSSIISVFWVFLFCFVFQIPFFLFLFLSFFQLCFGQHKCFQFSKKTISKTLSFVSRIVQSYRFLKGRFGGKFG